MQRLLIGALALFAASAPAAADELALADGESLYFEKIGSGPETLVLVSQSYADRLAAALEDPRWTIIAYDPRGRGRSSYVDNAATINFDQHMDDLDQLLDHVGAAQAHLVGFSYGGRLLASYASARPDRVGRLVMVSPAPAQSDAKFVDPSWGLAEIDATTIAAFRAAYAQRPANRHARYPQAYCYEERYAWALLWSSSPDDVAANAPQMIKVCGEAYANEWPVFFERYQAAVNPSREARFDDSFFARLTAPTLIMHGTRDRNTPVGGSRYWAWKIADARMITVPDRSHGMVNEIPDQLAATIKPFLAGGWPEGAQHITESPLAVTP